MVLYLAAATWCIFHALLHKQEPQAAMGWIGICIFMPIAGVLLYLLFGINRVRARARELQGPGSSLAGYRPVDRFELRQAIELTPASERLSTLSTIGASLTGLPLTANNRVALLDTGEAAYEAMLDAIATARDRVWLSTYIFDADAVGQRFVAALANAHQRGADVRVIVDGLGQWYSFPPVREPLRQAGLRHALFLPPRLVPPSLQINLRNHRKLLIVDRQTGFTGGMNISERHVKLPGQVAPKVRDTHFLMEGPIVGQMATVFLEDWDFCTGTRDQTERRAARSEQAQPASHSNGALCRVVADGPNDEVDKLIVLITGAIADARQRVLIVTPYFLPTRELSGALQSAAMRGIEVTVLLPQRNNLPYVHWASRHVQARLLRWGIDIRYQPGGFVHSKLLLVDDDYLLVGSPNLDERSLRLNFELAVEIIDPDAVASAAQSLASALDASRPVSAEALQDRPPFIKVRDAVCWLFSPYL